MASNSLQLLQTTDRPRLSAAICLLDGNYTGKWVSRTTFPHCPAGRRLTSPPTDLTGDNFFNDRPSIASSASACTGSHNMCRLHLAALTPFRSRAKRCFLSTMGLPCVRCCQPAHQPVVGIDRKLPGLPDRMGQAEGRSPGGPRIRGFGVRRWWWRPRRWRWLWWWSPVSRRWKGRRHVQHGHKYSLTFSGRPERLQ